MKIELFKRYDSSNKLKKETFYVNDKIVLIKNYFYIRNNHTPVSYSYDNINKIINKNEGDIEYNKLIRKLKLDKLINFNYI